MCRPSRGWCSHVTEAQFHAFAGFMVVWSVVMITVSVRGNRRIRRDIEIYQARAAAVREAGGAGNTGGISTSAQSGR